MRVRFCFGYIVFCFVSFLSARIRTHNYILQLQLLIYDGIILVHEIKFKMLKENRLT